MFNLIFRFIFCIFFICPMVLAQSDKIKLRYVWANFLKNECVQLYQEKIIRVVDNKNCKNISIDSYLECSATQSDSLDLGKILSLTNEIQKRIIFNELLTQDVQDFYNNDKEGKQIFLQYLFDSFYSPCLLSNKDQKEKLKNCNKIVEDQKNILLADKKKDREFMEKIKNFYKDNYLITLNRDMKGYHYTSFKGLLIDKKIDKKTRKETALQYVRYISSKGNTPGSSSDMEGGGLYLAIDPFISKHHGEVLIQLDFKKGQNFLDIRNKKIDFPQAITEELKKKCDYSKFYGGYIGGNISSVIRVCPNVFIPIFKELGIDGLLYEYDSGFHCDSMKYAIVNWNSKINLNNIEILDKLITDQKKINPSWSKTEKEYFEEYKAFDSKEPSKVQKEIISKRRKNAYGCDLKLHPNEFKKSALNTPEVR
ncbi:MAG: hypothetical protein U0T83_06435 [Bacteriovoracaceae bacterium]